MTLPMVTNLPEMTEQQRVAFYANYTAEEKSEVAGVLFAVFLGGIGAHHFYLRRTGLGILYLVFAVTAVPALIALVEAFFMPGRVREFNSQLSTYLAAAVTGQPVPGVASLPAPAVFCSGCGTSTPAGVRFCGRCGAAIAS
jgi:TM2 domain-containing membrane protein YozV